jgi:adenylosuccinate lyase
MLNLFAKLMEELIVYPERMLANLEATGGAIFSQQAMLRLVEAGLDRQDAYKIVQQAAHAVWDGGGHMRATLKGSPQVTAVLADHEIDALFSYDYHLRHIDTAFERIGLLEPAKT